VRALFKSRGEYMEEIYKVKFMDGTYIEKDDYIKTIEPFYGEGEGIVVNNGLDGKFWVAERFIAICYYRQVD
jgi:hypothetical protein